VKSVIHAEPRLGASKWQRLRTRAIFDYCKWDPQCEDHSVLADFPLVINTEEFAKVSSLAERLSLEGLAAEREILSHPPLMERLAIAKGIRKVLERARDVESKRSDVRVMRFDFHYTVEGWRISEVNADVPGGYVEASGWNELFAAEYAGTMLPPDASRRYVEAILRTAGEGSQVALAHSTVYSEDRQVMAYLAKVMTQCGLRPCLVSPQHIRWKQGRAQIDANFACGEIAAVVRLCPAEWIPSSAPRGEWKSWFAGSQTPLSNPGCALVLQSKRFPLVWCELRSILSCWREVLPEAIAPSELPEKQLEEWVFKPAFGRVGEDVGIRGVTPNGEYDKILRSMRKHPQDWIAQRRFQILPVETEDGPMYPCIGVYTVDGKTAGLYGRVSRRPLIDHNALDAAVLLREYGKEQTI
jgi:glutathionylspermidine synthase